MAVHACSVAAAVLDYMQDFGKVVAEGTVDEKRRFIRAFTKGIELDPETNKGQAQLYMLPDPASLSRCPSTSAESLFCMVAGAGFEPATSRL